MKRLFPHVLIGAFIVLNFNLFAQPEEKEIDSKKKRIPDTKTTYYVCNYEALPDGIAQLDSINFFTEMNRTKISKDSMTLFYNLAIEQLKQKYGADDLLAVSNQLSVDEHDDLVITVYGYPVKWINFQPLTEGFIRKQTPCLHNLHAFGIDLGIGTILRKEMDDYFKDPIYYLRSYPVFALGVRYTYNFNRYFGADFKINFQSPFMVNKYKDVMNMQFTAGIRGNTPLFYKCMSVFCVARMGYGICFNERMLQGLAVDTELGMNITRNFSIAFSYNLLSLFSEGAYYDKYFQYKDATTINVNTLALRLGFTF